MTLLEFQKFYLYVVRIISDIKSLLTVQIFTAPDERKAWVAGYDLSVINTAIKYNWPNEWSAKSVASRYQLVL